MNFSTYDNRLQVEVSPDGEVITVRDERFPWTERKIKTVKLAKLYLKAGYPELSLRAATCATWLNFGESAESGEIALQGANFCHLRLCPMCIARRAKRSAYKLSRVLDMVEEAHGTKFLFLTLTMQNVDGKYIALGDALSLLTKGWYRLMEQRQIERTVKGWFRAVEITRGDNRWHIDHRTGKRYFRKDEGYHPHIHAVLAVPSDYFGNKALYIRHEDWVQRWKNALRVAYEPSVRIEAPKAKGEYRAERVAATEAAKYAVKDGEYIDDTLPESRLIEILTEYTEALHRRRLTAFGGWMKEAAKSLDADDLDDGDLVHVDDDGLREDVADLIRVYNWHFGAGDYVLTSRQVNPLKLQRKA